MMLGRVDEVDDHYIATKFLLVVPLGSFYIADDKGRATSPIAIKTNWKSAGLGFARVWLPVFGVVWPVLVGWGPNGSIPIWGWLTSVVLIAIAGYAHRVGRDVPEGEKARLRLLGTVTGMRIDPAKQKPETRSGKRAALEDLMTKGGIPTTPADIIAVLDDIPSPALPLVYGFARYSGDDAIWRDTAEKIYDKHERGDI